MTVTVVAVLVLVLSTLVYLQVAHVRAVRAERGRLFDRVSHLFDEVKIRQEGLNYPVLTGRLHGRTIKLEPILDTLGRRKLPVLWLLITYYRPLPVQAPLDVLLRPHGSEFFSPNERYEEMAPGAGYPDHVRVASRAPESAPDPAALEPFLPFLHQPDTKEVFVAGIGVRVVRRLAEQAHHRVTRRVEMRPDVTEDALVPVLTTLTALAEAFTESSFAGPAGRRSR